MEKSTNLMASPMGKSPNPPAAKEALATIPSSSPKGMYEPLPCFRWKKKMKFPIAGKP